MDGKGLTHRRFVRSLQKSWRILGEMENAQELIQRLNHSGKKLSKSHRRIAECIVTHL